MDPVSAVRSLIPVPQPSPSPSVGPSSTTTRAGTAAPVTAPLRKDAVAQPAASASLVASQLAERDESLHPASQARAAADAARKAYIRASLAAGMNPLPLP